MEKSLKVLRYLTKTEIKHSTKLKIKKLTPNSSLVCLDLNPQLLQRRSIVHFLDILLHLNPTKTYLEAYLTLIYHRQEIKT